MIPPGQFCLLLTEEKVFIPNNAIGLISIKAGVKFRGLINVSGFHVDSGFQGRLKFSVYNAGSQNIVLQRKQRVFLLWFCDLDRTTSDTYKGTRINQSEISTEDVMRMQGEIASPGQLRKEIQEVQTNVRVLNWMLGILVTIVFGFIFLFLRGNIQPTSNATQPAQVTIQSTNTVAAKPVPQLSKVSMSQTGKLFIFEGPDGSGKTTLSRAFAEHLNACDMKCEWFSFPGGARNTWQTCI